MPKATGSGPRPHLGQGERGSLESRAEVRPEVRVAREDVRRGLGVHTKARYTDNIMAITSANTTAKGLKRPRNRGEIVVSMVSDPKAPVAIPESDPARGTAGTCPSTTTRASAARTGTPKRAR